MADERVDALFALPPEDFTAARNDLARELRAAGERDRAKEVARLRRPTVAAWAVNQAVRADPAGYAALLDSGREVRRAQRRALSGMAKSGLREAGRARRDQIERLAGQAAALVADAGGDPGAHRDDIVATFDAASATEEAGEEVGAARLSRPLATPSTFGDLAALAVVPDDGVSAEEVAAEEADRAAGAEGDGAAGQRRAATDAVAAARRRAEDAASARTEAHDAAELARRRADDAGSEADRIAADAERARREAERRERRAEAARRDAQRRSDEAVEAERAAADADRVAEARARDLEEAEERLRAVET